MNNDGKKLPWVYKKYIKVVISLFLYQMSIYSEMYWKYAMSIYSSK